MRRKDRQPNHAGIWVRQRHGVVMPDSPQSPRDVHYRPDVADLWRSFRVRDDEMVRGRTRQADHAHRIEGGNRTHSAHLDMSPQLSCARQLDMGDRRQVAMVNVRSSSCVLAAAACGGSLSDRWWCVPHVVVAEYAPGLREEAHDTQCREPSRPSHDLVAFRGLVRLRWLCGRVHHRANLLPCRSDDRLTTCTLLPLDGVCELATLDAWIKCALHGIEPRRHSEQEADGQGAAQPSIN
jgi:hypothetical protein